MLLRVAATFERWACSVGGSDESQVLSSQERVRQTFENTQAFPSKALIASWFLET